MAVDGTGNLFIADSGNGRIRKVDTNGIISTVAGTMSCCSSGGDGGPAARAQLNSPYGVAVDRAGNLFIADTGNHRIRAVNTQAGTISVFGVSIEPGAIATVAGSGVCCGFSGDNGPAVNAQIYHPYALAIDGAGNLYIADSYNYRIRKVGSGGTMTTVTGTGNSGAFGGDGGPASGAQILLPTGLTLDGAGNLYFVDDGNGRLRVVNMQGISITALGKTIAAGNIATVAGNGTRSYGGDGGVATGAQFSYPIGRAVDSAGNVYIADYGNNRIRVVNTQPGPITVLGVTIAPGNIATVAGTGIAGYSGDLGPATNARLSNPSSVALDAAGNLYIADSDTCYIRKVNPSGIITTVAGNGTPGPTGDGGPATSAQLYLPYGVTLDKAGNLYITDSFNNRVRAVNMQASPITVFGVTIQPGYIDTVVGSGASGPGGDGGAALNAELSQPFAMAIDGNGNLYIADLYNHRIRRVDAATKIITTVAGNGTYGPGGDGGAATNAPLNQPYGVAMDGSGNLYIADSQNSRIRAVNTHASTITVFGVTIAPGNIATVAGNGTFGFSGDSGAATNAQLNNPIGVNLDGLGNLYIADFYNMRIRRVDGPKVAPAIHWATPAAIAYGTPLTPAQLNATASTAGTFVYNPPAGSLLAVGPHALSVTFTPYNTVNYTTVSTTVNLNVGKTNSTTSIASNTPNPSLAGQLVTISFKVTGGPSPTGSVQVTASTSETCNGTLSAGAGSCGITFTTLGSRALTAVYGGDGNFNGSSSSPTVSQTVNAASGLAFSPGSVSFGTVTLWGGTSQVLTVTNTGAVAVKFTKISLSSLVGATTQDLTYDGGCESQLAAGKSCKITLSLWPGKAGSVSALLNLQDNAPGSPQTVAITATVIAPMANVSPASSSFASQTVNTTSAAKTVTLSNPGVGALAISGITLTGANSADFLVTGNTCSSSLSQSSSCTISVTFNPKASGARSATLKITDNAQSGSQTVSLAGTGN